MNLSTLIASGPLKRASYAVEARRGRNILAKLALITIFSSFVAHIYAQTPMIMTVAGTGITGYGGDGGAAATSTIWTPLAIATDAKGNIYQANPSIGSHPSRIRKIDTAGIITTCIGTGISGFSGDGGPATAAQIIIVSGIACDTSGNIYILDEGCQRIRKVNTSGIITTVAGNGSSSYSGDGGAATAAGLGNFPVGTSNCLASDPSGNLYVYVLSAHKIRRIDHSTGIITWYGGNGGASYTGDGGPATAAEIGACSGLAADGAGSVYITFGGIRKINAAGIINAYAGTGASGFSGDGGPATAAKLYSPQAIAVDSSGNLYIADDGNNRIRKVSASGIISTVAGTGTAGFSGDGGPATAAAMNGPAGIAVDPGGHVYIGDAGNSRIRAFARNRPVSYVTGYPHTLSLCENGIDSINNLLQIHDSDRNQPETFTVISAPVNGVASMTVTAVSNGTNVIPSGAWYKPNTGFSGIDSFRVRVTDAFTSDTVTIHVTVNPLPTSITGTANVCVGGSVTLSTTTGGGTWSASNSNATLGGSTGLATAVAGVTAGLDTIKYTLPTGCGVSRVVTVNGNPSVSGTGSVCVGATTTYIPTPGGGTWTSGATGIATIGSTSGTITGVAAGSAGITYTLPTGCNITTAVLVNSNPNAIAGAGSVCAGATTTLSTSTSGGTWSSSSSVSLSGTTGTTVNVTGSAAGAAGITYTLPTGCYTIANITVNPLPNPITGMDSICAGQTLTLHDFTPGGTWSSGATGTAIVNGTTGVVTGVATGTAPMTYTLLTGCKASATITVNVSPVTITGSPVLCLGYDDTLTDATGGGTWTNANTAIAFVDAYTGIMTGFSTGSDVVTYTLSNGCYTTMGVAINTAPGAIAGAGSVCAGANANLFNSVSGGIWSSGNTAVATIGSSSGVYTGVSAGTATINYSTGGACIVSTTVTVLPAPAAISGPLAVCSGGSTMLTTTSSGGTWSTTSSRIALSGSTGSTMTVTGVTAGTAVVTYTTGCFTTATVTVNPAPVITGTLSVCPAGSTLLTVTSGGSGTWSSSNTAIATIGSTGILTGVTSGTVTIVFTGAAGCNASAVVTVNPLPGAIVGPGSVCTGSSVSLSTSPSGGTWSRSNSNINISSSSGLTIGASAGTGIVTYTLPTGCYATKTITVYTTPAAISGPATGGVCVGATAALGDATPGGTWSTSNAAVAGAGSTSGMVSGVAPGTAVISYIMGTGCVATAIVTVNALPALFTVTGGGGICPGSSGLHIGMSGSATGTSYALYRGGTATGTSLPGTGSSIDFGLQGTGTYTVMATTAAGCTNTMTGSVTVSLNPTPVISGPSAVCNGTTTTLAATPAGTWSSSNPSVAAVGSSSGGSTGLTMTVTGVAIGTATITCTSAAGCTGTTTMNVTSAPGAITGSSTVCTGASTILTSTPSGGLWTSSNIAIAPVGSLTGVVTGAAPGSVTITYSLGTVCNTTATINVLNSPAAITGTFGVCSGNTTALYSTTAGGTWSSGATGIATISTSGIATGGTAGTATISYTVGGCSSTAVVTVNAVPPAIGGPASLCQGTTAAETNTMSGGVWSTSSAGIGIIGAGATATITGTSSGVGTITYNVSGCSTVKTITVNTAPTITGTRTLCTGNSTTLTTGVSGSWSSGASGIATITAGGLVNAVSAGTAPITFTPPTGCIATTTITVNSTPPPITGPTNVCAGSTTAYTAAGGTWVSGNASVATIGSSTGILTAISPGVVTITCPPTGCSSSLTITVNALPAAITGSSTLCLGTTTVLASTTSGGIWNSTSTPVATVGSSTGIVNGITTGTADISYTVSGCSVTKSITVTAIPSISGPNKVCMGSTITLTPGTTGGTWSSSNPVVASVGTGTGIVTGASLGNAIISYSLGPGCMMTTPIRVDSLPLPITGSTNICAGSTTTVHDATPGGLWSSGTAFAGVNSATGVVTGIAGGLAVISYTGPNSCATSIFINVIQPQPITGIRALCAWGDTMTVSNPDTTGIYTSTFATVLNVGHGRGIVTARVQGVSTITYTLPLGCRVSAPITVNPLPAGISGTLDLCPGGTGMLSDVSPGGLWSSGMPTVATIGATSGAVTAIFAGATNITYTLPTGCKADTLLSVTAPPVAGTITGRADLCVGSSTLFASATGGVWSSGMPSVATISTTGVVTGVSTGTATIAYSVSNLCGTDATQATVNVYPAVIAGSITGLDTICAGNSTMLADTAIGGVWTSTNTGIASVGSMGEVLGLLAGTDTVTYRVANPGCSAMAMHSITVLPHAVCGLSSPPLPLQERGEMLRVWPNPNDGSFSIMISSANDQRVDVTVHDLMGRTVLYFTGQSNIATNVSLKNAPGIYFISAQTAAGFLTSKVEISK